MKNRLPKSFLSINFLLLFAGSTFFSILSPLILSGTASAANTASYVFDTPKDGPSLAALKKAIDNKDEKAAAFGNTAVYVRGDFSGDTPLGLRINTARTGCAQAAAVSNSECAGPDDNFGGPGNDVYVYSATYTCTPGGDPKFSAGNSTSSTTDSYVVDYSVSLQLGKTGEDHSFFNKDGQPDSSVRLHWVGFGSNKTAGVRYYAAAPEGSATPPAVSKDIRDLPSKCLPPNVPSAIANADDLNTETNNKGITNLDIAYIKKASQAGQESWGDLSGVANSPGNSSGGSVDAPGLTCNVTANPLTWLLCPAVKGMVNIVGQLDNIITRQLTVGTADGSSDPTTIFCQSDDPSAASCAASSKAYYKAWSTVRNIALGLLVVAGLIIVISQALGTELLDAYTIKKTLPRLIIAALLITLSWPLMQFFVRFSNDLGFGVRYLIYQPFSELQNAATLGGGAQVASNIVGAGAILALGIFGLLSFAVTAALAVFIAFIVLILRQLLIVVLIIFAPIALVAFVLPNTQKIYKLWYESFSKALLMFPIIAAFIAVGRVFSAVSGAGAENATLAAGTFFGGSVERFAVSGAGSLGELIGFAAYFAPYFLLPYTFKLAGGALGNIAGVVNNTGKGGFDRLKNYRGNKAKTNLEAMKQGNRYKASNPLAKGINTATRGISNAGNAGMIPWKMQSRYQAGMSQQKMVAISEYMDKNEAFSAIKGNDDYLQATMKNMGGGDSEADWRRYLAGEGYEGRSLEQGVAGIRAAKRATSDDVFKMAAVAANGSTGTGWKEGGIGQMNESINEAVGDDRDMAARLTAMTRGSAERAGRLDLAAPGFGGHLGNVNDMHEQYKAIDNDATLSSSQKIEQKAAIRAQSTSGLVQKGLDVRKAGDIMGSRGQSFEQFAPVLVKNINDAHSAVKAAPAGSVAKEEAQRKLAQEYATLSTLQDSFNTSPENIRKFADTVLGAEIPGGTTIGENMKQFADDPNYQQVLRSGGSTDYERSQAGAPKKDDSTTDPKS